MSKWCSFLLENICSIELGNALPQASLIFFMDAAKVKTYIKSTKKYFPVFFQRALVFLKHENLFKLLGRFPVYILHVLFLCPLKMDIFMAVSA